jgi:hypothetical protein
VRSVTTQRNDVRGFPTWLDRPIVTDGSGLPHDVSGRIGQAGVETST